MKPQFLPITKRQPYREDIPDGYVESLNSWFDNNSESVQWFLENGNKLRRDLNTLLAYCESDEEANYEHNPESGKRHIVHVIRRLRKQLETKI